MNWIFYAIVAHFFWALTNIGDKYIVGHRVKNPYVYLVWMTMSGIISVVFIPYIDFFIPDTQTLVYLCIAGVAYFFGGLPYIRAMQLEEPTRINVWWNLIPLFSFGLGWIIFGDMLSSQQLLAFVVLVFAAFVASVHIRKKIFSFSRAFGLMVIATFSYALYAVMLDRAMFYISFLHAFVWVHLIMFVCAGTLFISKQFRTDFFEQSYGLKGNLGGVVAGITLLDHAGIFFHQIALSLAIPSLVFAFEGSQVIFVFIIATLLSFFLPHIVKEEIDKKNILLKILAILLMGVGVVLLSFN
ncbi:MAG: hypothetical protein COX81_03625 [Candidatus Magasanikbacteria bacterium CG_4_10_14_0_2_um_filter_37_12]|uniref:EamA domain-containing protein n=1 Tax=Candidatus Magasanikbacteria bacterium CG_4_10_14_0_2_um_filter_37_12 TaxID=1974637 RepID=A0A2M7V6V8_9BACT|nr:MAG: hypothetical protein COX81_03625 [Candidatus Magasanikbacteria bacterium CG_4_10_14_0_2_um_filter_37_12]